MRKLYYGRKKGPFLFHGNCDSRWKSKLRETMRKCEEEEAYSNNTEKE